MTAQRLKGKKKGSHKPLTFEDMMQIGLGVLRYSPSVFYELTLQQLLAAMKGAAEAEERAYQQQWTQTRWLASLLLQPHSKKGIKPSDLCTFPWEQIAGKEVSKEEGNKMQLQALQKYFKNGTA
mgnify:CR=1 FL=1